jgi:uroporphyrin-III C-methyltransferase
LISFWRISVPASRTTGEVFLAGAGPGDPDLLTVKTLRLLQSAEVVIYDRLVSAEILALANPEAEFIYAGKDEGHQDVVQAEIYRLLADRAGIQGRRVVRLKGGDPFIFGRGAEEMQFLRQLGIPVEVVPGVSSAVAGPAAAGIPVTHRGTANALAIVSARCKGGSLNDWRKVAHVDTLVVLMGIKYRQTIAQALIDSGRSAAEPVAFVENACTPGHRVVEATLELVAEGAVEVGAPAVMVIGEVVRLRRELVRLTASVTETAEQVR